MFLNLESTKQALNNDEQHSHQWESCNYGINMKFHTNWMHNFSPWVGELLDAGLLCRPCLLYLGNQAWNLGSDLSHKDDFNSAKPHDWKGGGLARTSNGLTFLQVYDAGHMVPADQPNFLGCAQELSCRRHILTMDYNTYNVTRLHEIMIQNYSTYYLLVERMRFSHYWYYEYDTIPAIDSLVICSPF
jgi:hypothetical protein